MTTPATNAGSPEHDALGQGASQVPCSGDLALVLGGMPTVERVRELERTMLQYPQIDLSTQHLVHAGMYARTILIPAGTALTGAATNAGNISVVMGEITVTTDGGPRYLTGFNVLPAQPGSKRVGLAHSDTYWTTLFRTDQVDINDIERELTDEADRLQSNNLHRIGAN